MPYYTREGGRRVKKSAYGSIENVIVHHLHPGGPRQCILQVRWFRPEGIAPSGNPLVDTTDDSETTFEFIEDCYEMPVAVWPHDPLGKLGSTNPARKYSEIIDRNQDQDE